MLKRFLRKIKARFVNRQREAARYEAARAIISQSKLFDAQWYAERYPDVATGGADPLEHFIRFGAAERRNPSSRFDIRWYVRKNPDVAQTNANPLLHYLEHGRDEGRSIRAVSKTREEEDLYSEAEPSANRKKSLFDGPPVAPYPSDFILAWQARPSRWSAYAAVMLSGKNNVVEGASSTQRTLPKSEDLGDTAESARIQLFHTMRRDVSAADYTHGQDASPPKRLSANEAHHLLTAYGLGFMTIADGWFSGHGKLTLRLHAPGAEATYVRAFSYHASGHATCCGDVETGGGRTVLLELNLEHELYPVLLAFYAADGTMIANALIPFPSLFRGGLHRSELAAHETISGTITALADHMTSLALQAYCWPDAEDSFAIAKILVDLDGANGTEKLFSSAAVTALAVQFGLRLDALGARDDRAPNLLADRLKAPFTGERVAGRSNGRTLILPADGFPSLACLAVRTSHTHLGASSFCVVEAATHKPRLFVCQPEGAAESSALRHPSLPRPRPMLAAMSAQDAMIERDCGTPIMIRFRDDKIWNVDELMPLAPDTQMPKLTRKQKSSADARPAITVIIDNIIDGDLLSLCLISLARQTIADQLDIRLISNRGLPQKTAEHFDEDRITLSSPEGTSRAERLNAATADVTTDYLLVLDAALCLPDPRTLALLLEIVCQSKVATASCALVSEDDTDGSTIVQSAGYFDHGSAGLATAGSVASYVEIAQLFPASTFPVIANDMRLCLISADIWRKMDGLNAQDFPDHHYDIDFGLRSGNARYGHYCTTLTRAAIASQAEAAPAVPLPSDGLEPLDRLVGSVTRIRKLCA